jgi:hypothetical protein
MAMSGGSKMRDLLNRIADRVQSAKSVDVGFLQGSTNSETGASIPLYAFVNEFGAPSRGQPPRPFFRNMIAANSPGWGTELAEEIKSRDYDAASALAVMGKLIQGQLKASIYDLTSPPLSPKTIARKGFDKPLVDTSEMVKSVAYEVKT